MKELITVLPVSMIPNNGIWQAILEDGTLIIEDIGKVSFPDVQKDIKAFNCFGITLPSNGDKYEFSRQAVASPGLQPTAISATVKIYYNKERICLIYRFLVPGKSVQ